MNDHLRRSAALIALAGFCAFASLGCASAATSTETPAQAPISSPSATPSLPFFQTKQTSADQLPAMIPNFDLDLETSRFLGDDASGYHYYAVRTAYEGLTCLIMVTDDGRWARGCSGGFPVGTALGSTVATLDSEPADAVGLGQLIGKYLHVIPY